jgi:hypothetical protein
MESRTCLVGQVGTVFLSKKGKAGRTRKREGWQKLFYK